MYYIILSSSSTFPANKQYLSFSTTNHDVCFGHTKPEIIKEYTLEMYLTEFGDEIINTYERNERYELISCKKTILDVVAEWNYGARIFKENLKSNLI